MDSYQLTLAVLFGLFATRGLACQTVRPEPNAVEVAARLRKSGQAGGAVAVLSQARGPEAAKKMDDIADSLVAIAVGFPGQDARGARTRGAALNALVLAGIGSSGVVGTSHGIPYRGAAERLKRISEAAEDVGIRATALLDLTKLPDRANLLPFLRQVATSQRPVADRAVTLLAEETGPDGQSIARNLYRNGGVTQKTAKEMLDRAAFAHGWQ